MQCRRGGVEERDAHSDSPQVWVAVYFAFDSGSVVKSLKASLHGQWSEFYQQLPSATVVALPDCNAVWSAYCWTEFVAYVENDWYQAQAVAFSLLLLFPLCMLLAGEALGCGTGKHSHVPKEYLTRRCLMTNGNRARDENGRRRDGIRYGCHGTAPLLRRHVRYHRCRWRLDR